MSFYVCEQSSVLLVLKHNVREGHHTREIMYKAMLYKPLSDQQGFGIPPASS